MERVGQILRALFRRALSEHGQEAPALTDILIERARGRFEPRLGARFTNGYVTWAELRPADCYAFCTRHAAWDLDSLNRALLREGHELYARMRADHLFELSRGRGRRERPAETDRDASAFTLLSRLRREADGLDQWQHGLADPAADDLPPRRERHGRLMAWWNQQRNQLGSVFFLRGGGSAAELGSRKAQERGLQLLRE